jgi:ABC-2 type transport system permease protein
MKYLAFVRIGLCEAWVERGELVARLFYLPVVLGIFTALWRAVSGAGRGISADPGALVWYLATTEWIFFSIPALQHRLAEEVRRGDVAYQLARPISYLGAHWARALGHLALRLPVIGVAAAATAWTLAGPPQVEPRAAALALLLGFGACVLGMLCNLLIGVASFWLEEIQPLQWIWNKLSFVFGGLMLPLSYCPPALQRFAEFTPFPSLLYRPASLQLGQMSPLTSALALDLAFWLVATGSLVLLGFRRARARLTLSGG